jgi:hypothetical protein
MLGNLIVTEKIGEARALTASPGVRVNFESVNEPFAACSLNPTGTAKAQSQRFILVTSQRLVLVVIVSRRGWAKNCRKLFWFYGIKVSATVSGMRWTHWRFIPERTRC